MANVRNNDLNAVKGLPWETIVSLFPKAHLRIEGEKWVLKYFHHDKKNPDKTYAKGEWVSTTYPQKFKSLQLAWEVATARFSKGHYRITRVIPEIEQPTEIHFHNVIMSDC